MANQFNRRNESEDNSKSITEIKMHLKSLEAKVDTVLKQQIKLTEILNEQNMLLRRSLGQSSQNQKPIPTKTGQCLIDFETEEHKEEKDKCLSLPLSTSIKIQRKSMKGKRGRSLSSSSSSSSPRQFPLKTEDDVFKINEELKGYNKNEIIKLITQLLAGNIANIERILETELVYNLNYDGTKGKIPLKSYTHFVAALFEATKKNLSTHENFVFELRVTFRKLKNKFQKRLQKQRSLDPLKSTVDDMDLSQEDVSLFPDTGF